MLCFGRIIRTRCPFFIPADGLYAADTLYEIYIPKQIQTRAAVALNSVLTMLMLEYAGRTNLSGIVSVQRYELAALPVPNPYGLSAAPRAALLASNHALLARDRRTETGFRMTLTASRRALDERVFAWLGLTEGERDAVYGAAYDAVVKRQLSEASVSSDG